MVSIIVPIYNVENYLDKCIESLVKQTFRNTEIILIDDGSTDRCREICLKWQNSDKRIVYVRKKNEGQGIARNIGVKISKGDYITFVDSDDWLEKDAIECLYEAAKKSNADIVVSDINYITKDNNGKVKTHVSRLRIDSEVVVDTKKDIYLIDTARLGFGGKMFEKNYFRKNYIEQPGHAFEDAAIMPLLVAKADTIYRVPRPFYNYYRVRMNSTVNTIKSYDDLIKTLEKTKEDFEREGLFSKYYEALKKVSYAQVRFAYKKLLGKENEVDLKYKIILEELYEFMDKSYPDWINIDKYSIGMIGNILLKRSIQNTVYNDYMVKESVDNYEELLDRDILIIDLVDKVLFANKEIWKDKCLKNLELLKEKFKGMQILLIKFKDEKYDDVSTKLAIDYIYDSYQKSNLNVKVIEFNSRVDSCDENLSWDLSDKILRGINVG